MGSFADLKLSTQLQKAIEDLGLIEPTPIQLASFPVILSGRDVVGISQTGTGKTFAYLFPLLRDISYSEELHPRILILVPTRELVSQVVKMIEQLTTYMSIRVIGVFGGVNLSRHKEEVASGVDVLVATPGRLYDLIIHKSLSLKKVKKVVIDEVDIMLDLGFRFQLANIFDHLPGKRQHILFSATMTEEVNALLEEYLGAPHWIRTELSREPLKQISQSAMQVPNFHTKANYLASVLTDKKNYHKVLLFVSTKRMADKLFALLEDSFEHQLGIIHSNKSQNSRERTIDRFDKGKKRILIATDIAARGLDFSEISHVFNVDVPSYPENYIHRIGRTGRADKSGESILLFTEREMIAKAQIVQLVGHHLEEFSLPDDIPVSNQLLPEERPKSKQKEISLDNSKKKATGEATHTKKQKNKKINLGGSYKRKLEAKYKKGKGKNRGSNR
ncbi:MAG: DEAD/DEAH box helicase, partial [Bacteroidota bacterium]